MKPTPLPPTLPPEIELRDQWPESRRYVLPARKLGHGRWIGGILLVTGLAISLSLIFIASAMVLGWRQIANPCSLFLVFIFGPVTWGGLAPLWWGLGCWFGHRELELKGGYLRTIERVGPFWRSRRWKIETIGSLQIKRISATKPPPIDLVGDFNALVLHTRAGKQGMLAWGYPVEMLNAFAPELARRMNEIVVELPRSSPESEVLTPITTLINNDEAQWAREDAIKYGLGANRTIRNGEDGDEFDDELDEELDPQPIKPVDTKIEVDELSEQELTIRIPPAGIRQGSCGLFVFSMIWCGFMLVFDAVAFASLLQNQGKHENIWGLLGFSALFWLVGIGMLLAAINLGRRKAALAVVGGQLMAIQTGIFGTKKREWQCGDVDSIATGPSGMEVNDVPVLELQIKGKDDSKFGMLAGRPDAELEWLAWTLRRVVFALRTNAGEVENPIDEPNT